MQPEVRESLWLGRRATGPCRRRGNALRGGSLRLNGHPYTCHRPSWGVVRIKSAVAHCQSMVTAIALLIVLDGLGVEHAAIGAPGGCAGGLLLDLVAAAVRVYDLGAHAGGGGGRAGGA